MNISHRLRTCAKHTGLDAVIELLQEAADEIDDLQARAQVQGEVFGYIHHFDAHDERGALIDTTWEADGCADPLPHPTFPAMWKWSHCTPFYTTPQPAQATQAEAKQPATPEPVVDVRCEGCGYMTHHREHMGCVRAAKQHTHPAQSVPDDVVRDAEQRTNHAD